MLLARALKEQVPSLRRFLSALTGSPKIADRYVRCYIQALIQKPASQDSNDDYRSVFYREVIDRWLADGTPIDPKVILGNDRVADIFAALGTCTPTARAAFLLTYLEDFTCNEAAVVLRLTPNETDALLLDVGKALVSIQQLVR